MHRSPFRCSSAWHFRSSRQRPPSSAAGLVPAEGRLPEAHPPVPVVGVGRCGPGRGVLGPCVEPDPLDGRFQVHTFTPLWIAFILLVNAFTLRRTAGALCSPGPASSSSSSRSARVLVVLRISQPLRRELALRRSDGIRGGGIFPLRNPSVLHRSPGGPFDRELLLSCPRFDGAFREWRPLSPARPGAIGLAALLLSCVGLFTVGIAPTSYSRWSGSPRDAPGLPRRSPGRAALAFRDRLRRLAPRDLFRPRRPSLRLLLGNVEFRKLREVGV